MEQSQTDVYERAFLFAVRVQRMEKSLSSMKTHVNRNSLNQLLNSSSSTGANLQEAKGAHSRADFHLKIRIALKEARESLYWLRLIAAGGAANESRFRSLITEANEIVAILTTIAKKTNPHEPQAPRTS